MQTEIWNNPDKNAMLVPVYGLLTEEKTTINATSVVAEFPGRQDGQW